MPTAKRVAAIGVLALAGALIAVPAAGAKAKVRMVPAGGLVALGSVRCEAREACVVKAPRQAKAQVAGGTVRAKTVVPGFVGPGGKATVKLRFGAGALAGLAGRTATFSVRVVVLGSGQKVAHLFKVRLERPAAAPTSSGGGAGTPSSTPASQPIEGEPPVLARPATAVTVGAVQLSWMPRDSWVRYVSSGTAAVDGVVPGGGATGVEATASPCSDRPAESSASLNYTINFAAKESWYDPLSGEAGIYGLGNVAFRYTAHTINLTAAEPEIEINGSASRAIFRFNGSGGTPYPNQRVALESLETAGRPTVTNEGKTLTYSLMHGRLTEDGEKVFAGFYPGPTDNEFGCVSASFTLP